MVRYNRYGHSLVEFKRGLFAIGAVKGAAAEVVEEYKEVDRQWVGLSVRLPTGTNSVASVSFSPSY